MLVSVNNRLKFDIAIVHDLSCHPIFATMMELETMELKETMTGWCQERYKQFWPVPRKCTICNKYRSGTGARTPTALHYILTAIFQIHESGYLADPTPC